MAQVKIDTPRLDVSLLELLAEERRKALSAREWKFRLAGFGYGIKEDGSRRVVTRLPNGSEIGELPENLR